MKRISNIYDGIGGECYGTYYNKDEAIEVECINKKWYDFSGSYIRDWNKEDEKEFAENTPW